MVLGGINKSTDRPTVQGKLSLGQVGEGGKEGNSPVKKKGRKGVQDFCQGKRRGGRKLWEKGQRCKSQGKNSGYDARDFKLETGPEKKWMG